jgi:3-dehydroquinate dehydratase / shikimate dehydrogenase
MENNDIRICVPVCERTLEKLQDAAVRAVEAGDLVELRLDCLEQAELDREVARFASLVGKLDGRAIITLRPAEQGGRYELDDSTRLRFWNALISSCPSALLDIELSLAEHLRVTAPNSLNWDQVICSHHDFTRVPADLEQIYERMARTPARILKVAVQAVDITDCIPVFRLLDRARREKREMIAVAMGESGVATRILGPSLGAFLTYGALDAEHGTAPGQIAAEELRNVYRIRKIDQETQILGLMGLPVAQSVSPHIHNAALEAVGANAAYVPFEVRDVPAFFRRMVQPVTREIDWNLRGLSVTAPHKSTVLDSLDWIEPAAREIGAVNTIVIQGDALHGYNTDAMAVLQPAIEKIGPVRGLRCVVIGAGGAASAALWSLKNAGARVTVCARNQERARATAARFDADYMTWEGARFDGFDLVMNATPLGMRGPLEAETPAIAEQLRGARLAYDLVYNPDETRFLREAREAGCETIGGLSMLVLQAAEQFRLWTGREPPVEVMREAARRALDQ